MAKYLSLDDIKVKEKVVLVRVDFNSPVDVKSKKVLDDVRIRAHGKTTIRELAERGARVVVLAHQGRKGSSDFISLKQHAEILSEVLDKPVQYVEDLYGKKAKNAIKKLKSGEILVLENVRGFEKETMKGTPDDHAKTELVQNLGPLADLFVNDAFATAHRAHVSIVGFTPKLQSAAGRIMERELKSLSRILDNPEKPCIFILGGAKADDTLDISRHVLSNNIADYVLTGGVVAQVFLVAKGYKLGNRNMSFLEKKGLMELIPGIKELVQEYPKKIVPSTDMAIEIDGKRMEITAEKLPTKYPIFDIGPHTIAHYEKLIKNAESIVVSGPMGVYENDEFNVGTKEVFGSVANSRAFSLAGGGHTIAALQKFGLSDKISYVSTAGGALIEFLMGKELPGVAALETAAIRTD